MSLKKLSIKIPSYLAAAIVLAALPLLIRSNYWIGTVNLAIIYSIAVLGLNIILGLTGQLSIAQAAFWGIGAYTAALLNTRLGWPFWATFLVAPPTAAAFGVILGFPTLKLSGRYLAMATIGFGIIVNLILHNWKRVFAAIPTESVIRDHQDGYYKAIEESSGIGESTPFVEFMLEVILETIQSSVNSSVKSSVNTEDKILLLIQDNPAITISNIAKNLGLTTRAIEKQVAKLKEEKKLKREGSARKGKWSVLDGFDK